MRTIYNDNDPFVAQWLRNLIAAGELPDGEVVDTDVRELDAERCAPVSHFFAGIGGWAYALRLAGWPGDRPVWTASLPCQPWSSAGKSRGVGDERHVWPAFHRLIAECHPPTIFGEQVASKDGLQWLAGVRVDLEALGYAVGAADLPAASVGAPHIRQRLWWVADAQRGGIERRRGAQDLDGAASQAQGETPQRERRGNAALDCGAVNRMDHADIERREGLGLHVRSRRPFQGPTETPWRGATHVECSDGRSRRIESGVRPLAHGIPCRMGRLRAYGNAIVPQVAAEFVMAFTEAEEAMREAR